jgi:hypothetical protein
LLTEKEYSKIIYTNSYIVRGAFREFNTIPESIDEQNQIIHEKMQELNISVFMFSSEKVIGNYDFDNYLKMNGLIIEKALINPKFGEIVYITANEN